MSVLDALFADDEAWMDDAACADVDDGIFYRDRGGSSDAALQVCGVCPVRTDCLEWADRTGMHEGVLGGMTGRQRQARRVAARADGLPDERERRWPALYDRAWLSGRVAAGATQADIAAQLGCSRSLVSAAMREQGVTPAGMVDQADVA